MTVSPTAIFTPPCPLGCCAGAAGRTEGADHGHQAAGHAGRAHCETEYSVGPSCHFRPSIPLRCMAGIAHCWVHCLPLSPRHLSLPFTAVLRSFNRRERSRAC